MSRLAGKTPFNSRPHTEVDINSCSYIYRKWSFQLTTSHGGRPIRSGERDYCYYLSTHDLTRRSTIVRLSTETRNKPFNSRPHTEVDNISRESMGSPLSFQLTTSHGGRPSICSSSSFCLRSFNSRPHTEVDVDIQTIPVHIYLSTHDLTRRSTRYILGIAAELFFQLTTSHGGRLRLYDFPRRVDPFNSRPHTEVDSPRRHRRSSL